MYLLGLLATYFLPTALLQVAAAWHEVLGYQGQGQRQGQGQGQGPRPVRDFAAEAHQAAAEEEAAATRRLLAAVAAHQAAKEWCRFCASPSDEARVFELFDFYRRDEAARCGLLPALIELCTDQRTWLEAHKLLGATRRGMKLLFSSAELFPVQVAGYLGLQPGCPVQATGLIGLQPGCTGLQRGELSA